MKQSLLLALLIVSTIRVFANDPILVTETTVALGFDEKQEFYFSLAEGDVIQFDFQMVKGKDIKSIEIIELPSKTLFSEYKATTLSKSIRIQQKGVYLFRFYNTALAKRVGKFTIHRTPSSDATKNFNTNWKWETIRDTLYIPYTIDSITGYNKIKYKEKVRELVKEEKIEDLLFDKSQRVHSYYNENKSSTYLKVDLPSPIMTDLKEEKVIAWAYWIGVGKEAQEAYQENAKAVGSLVKGIASVYATPLAGLAIGTITELVIPKVGDDVHYAFIPDFENAQKFVNSQTYLQFDMGKGIAAYGKNTNRTQGTFYIGLYNDNRIDGIDVNVKVIAIKESKTFEFKEYDKEREEPILVTLNKKRMEVNETQVRVPVE